MTIGDWCAIGTLACAVFGALYAIWKDGREHAEDSARTMGEIKTELKTHGEEIKEIKSEMKDIQGHLWRNY